MIEPRAFISSEHFSGTDASSADLLKGAINDAWSKHQDKEQPSGRLNTSETAPSQIDATTSVMQAFPVLSLPDYSSMKRGALYEPATVTTPVEKAAHPSKHHLIHHTHVEVHHTLSRPEKPASLSHSYHHEETAPTQKSAAAQNPGSELEDKTVHKATFSPVDLRPADLKPAHQTASASDYRETMDRLARKAGKEFEERPLEALAAAEISSPVLAAVAVGYGFAEAADLLHDGLHALSHLAHGIGKFATHEVKAVGHAAAKISHAFSSLATETDLAINESIIDIHDRQFAELDRNRRLEFYKTQDDDNAKAMDVPLSALHR